MYSQYVDPFYGNDESNLPRPEGVAANWFFLKAQVGNTHPGALLPFGMVSAAPYTGGYPTGCSSYWFNHNARPPRIMAADKRYAYGFSHFHQSGTGAIRQYYNFVTVTPVSGRLSSRYESFPLRDEKAHPGFYGCLLGECSAQITVTERAALYRFHFPREHDNTIIIDLEMNGLVKDGQMDAQMGNIRTMDLFGEGLLASIDYQTPLHIYGRCRQCIHARSLPDGRVALDIEGNAAQLCIGFSFNTVQRAEKHCECAGSMGFDAAHEKARAEWEQALSAIRIEADDITKQKFYSNFYHCLIKPTDITGDSPHYNDAPSWVDLATLWDMSKSQLPLLFMLYGKSGTGIVQSIMRSGEIWGYMPNTLLLTSPSTSGVQARALACCVLYDAYVRGIPGIDWNRALEIMVGELKRPVNGDFFVRGIVSEYPSHTLDLALACHACSRMAGDLGKKALADELARASRNWRNVYNPDTGLLTRDGKFYEGSHWNYSFRLLHEMPARMALSRDFTADLDRFFGYGAPAVRQCTNPLDSDCYEAGKALNRFEGFNNETDMETPYAYCYAGRLDRVAEIIRGGMENLYSIGRGALPGNDDSGGLGSCYVMNALGFFPASGQPIFLLGSPSVRYAAIKLHNGNLFEVEAIDNSAQNIYPKGIELNGRPLDRLFLTVDEVMKGGKLSMHMKSEP